LKDKLGLPDAIIEKTAYISRKAHERGLRRGRETSAALAAALYLLVKAIMKVVRNTVEALQKYLLLFCWVIHNRLFDDMVRQLGVSS
jgi:transcription initiation factor TFIIIB Brf1 subunit/transcription initiation factor TFIIB